MCLNFKLWVKISDKNYFIKLSKDDTAFINHGFFICRNNTCKWQEIYFTREKIPQNLIFNVNKSFSYQDTPPLRSLLVRILNFDNKTSKIFSKCNH